eukprot:IDg11242t1
MAMSADTVGNASCKLHWDALAPKLQRKEAQRASAYVWLPQKEDERRAVANAFSTSRTSPIPLKSYFGIEGIKFK